MNILSSFSGEIAALTAACLWAISSVIYSNLRVKLSPLLLNLLKGIIAVPLLGITIIVRQDILQDVNSLTIQLLLFSGVIGIGIGDTAFFFALQYLGVRRALLMETLAPPLTAIFGLIFLQEALTIQACCGIIITILGVVWVITERTEASVITAQQLKIGIVWALLTEVAQAAGMILSRSALVNSSISPVWSTLLRLLAGLCIVAILLLIANRNQSTKISFPWSLQLIAIIFLATFTGTYLGMGLQQTSLKYTSAGIAQTLSSTSPLFILPIVFLMGEKVSIRAIGGVIISVVGIGLLFNTLNIH